MAANIRKTVTPPVPKENETVAASASIEDSLLKGPEIDVEKSIEDALLNENTAAKPNNVLEGHFSGDPPNLSNQHMVPSIAGGHGLVEPEIQKNYAYVDVFCSLTRLGERVGIRGPFDGFVRAHPHLFPGQFEACISHLGATPEELCQATIWRTPGVYVVLGIPPLFAKAYQERELEPVIRRFLSYNGVRGIGGIGLDYVVAIRQCSPCQQREVFESQIVIAREHGQPVLVYCRNAFNDCLATLIQFQPNDYPIVMLKGPGLTYEVLPLLADIRRLPVGEMAQTIRENTFRILKI